MLEKGLASGGITRITEEFETRLEEFCADRSFPLKKDWKQHLWTTERSDKKISLHFHCNGIVFENVQHHNSFMRDFKVYLEAKVSEQSHLVLRSNDKYEHLVDGGVYTQ